MCNTNNRLISDASERIPCQKKIRPPTKTLVTLRPCSFVSDWWVGTIPNRIVSLIYINFD
jgi:hypothetical protein